jgi:hypothetical protein
MINIYGGMGPPPSPPSPIPPPPLGESLTMDQYSEGIPEPGSSQFSQYREGSPDIRLGSHYSLGESLLLKSWDWRGRISEEDRGRVVVVGVVWGGRGRRGGGNTESPPPLAKEAGTGPGQTYLPAPHRPLASPCMLGPLPSNEGCVFPARVPKKAAVPAAPVFLTIRASLASHPLLQGNACELSFAWRLQQSASQIPLLAMISYTPPHAQQRILVSVRSASCSVGFAIRPSWL